MERRCIRRKPSSPRSADGFTLVETLLALVVGVIVIMAAAAVGESTRSVIVRDQVRGANEQNLRSLLEYVGTEIRDAGHLMVNPTAYIEVIDGKSGGRDTDTLIVRRSLVDAPGMMCSKIEGASERHVTVAFRGDIGTRPAQCATAGDINGDGYDDFVGLWRAFRLQSGVLNSATGGRELKVLVFEPSTGKRELVTYFTEEPTRPTDQWMNIIVRANWKNKYYPSSSNPVTLTVIEERRFALQGSDLMMTLNEGTPQKVASRIDGFDVTAALADGTRLSNYTNMDKNVGSLSGIDVRLTSRTTLRGQSVTRTMADTFSPRNRPR